MSKTDILDILSKTDILDILSSKTDILDILSSKTDILESGEISSNHVDDTDTEHKTGEDRKDAGDTYK